MQRVRIGLTGLAFVFLAVLLAAVFTRTPTGEPQLTPNLIEQEQKAEPLAQLGVAPGAESNQSTPPPPTPAR